jgi:hypothetical protein
MKSLVGLILFLILDILMPYISHILSIYMARKISGNLRA